MSDFWQWVKSRQDAKHWSEDELACAELAWKEALKLKKENENGTFICSKCGAVCADNGGCYCPSMVA